MGFEIVSVVKVFGMTIMMAIIGSIVGVNMICQMEGDKLDEKCKSKILFVIERLVFSIFNTLVLGLGLLGFIFYKDVVINIKSHYFMLFLLAVLITSAMSFEITKKIVNFSREWLEKKSDEIINKEKNNDT